MGRCYEFGVEIHAGCEQAMVVTAEGGECECLQCGTTCPGRFAGCAAVVAVPGRVPPSAPAWSIPGAEAVAPDAGVPVGRRLASDEPAGPIVISAVPAARRAPPPPPVVVSPLAPPPAGNGARVSNGKPVDGAARLSAAVDALRDEVRDRDEQLAASLEAYADYQRQLAEQIALIGQAMEQLAAGVAQHSEQLALTIDRLTTAVSALEDRMDQPTTLRNLLGRRF